MLKQSDLHYLYKLSDYALADITNGNYRRGIARNYAMWVLSLDNTPTHSSARKLPKA